MAQSIELEYEWINFNEYLDTRLGFKGENIIPYISVDDILPSSYQPNPNLDYMEDIPYMLFNQSSNTEDNCKAKLFETIALPSPPLCSNSCADCVLPETETETLAALLLPPLCANSLASTHTIKKAQPIERRGRKRSLEVILKVDSEDEIPNENNKNESDESSEKCFTCEACNQNFKKEAYLKHKKRIHNEKVHICTSTAKIVQPSKNEDPQKPYEPKICGKPFATATELKNHHLRKHVDEKLWEYQCDYCLKKQSCRASKRGHEYQCPNNTSKNLSTKKQRTKKYIKM